MKKIDIILILIAILGLILGWIVGGIILHYLITETPCCPIPLNAIGGGCRNNYITINLPT